MSNYRFSLAALWILFAGGAAAAKGPPLPAWKTDEERRPSARRELKNATFRDNHPELYGITEPPVQPVTLYAEFEPVDGVYLAWFPRWEDPFFFAVFDAVVTYEPSVSVLMVVDGPDHEQSVRNVIQSFGGDPDYPEYVRLDGWPDFDSRGLESFWMVDYGPFWVLDGEGNLSAVDPKYNFDRVNDDAVPAKIAEGLGVNDYRPDLVWDGGNLIGDGNGLCVATWEHLYESLPVLPEERN